MSSFLWRAAPPRSAVVWSAVLMVSSLGILLGSGIRSNFSAEPSGIIAADTQLPELLEPQGELEHPPTVFRWVPGGDDVTLSQVLLFSEDRRRVWASAPLSGNELIVDPMTVLGRLAAGPDVLWTVREVSEGRPRSTGAAVAFSFAVDVYGRGIGESRVGDIPIRR